MSKPFLGIFVRDKEFYRTVLRVGIPVVMQSLISIGINMTDTVMLGHYGEIQISASSLCGEFISLFMILCFGIGGGAGVLTAQFWGAEDIPSLKQVVTIMLRLMLIVASVFLVVTAFFPDKIIAIYTPDTEIIEKGVLYLRMLTVSFPLLGLTLTLTTVLRTIRQVRIPLLATISVFFANIFGNWVFIFGNLGMPEMQIQGAALSTLICRIIECSIIAGYFFFVDLDVGYRIKELLHKVSGTHIANYMKYSVPVIVSDFFMAFGNSAVAMIMGRVGASFVAANAIISNVVRLSTVFNQGVSSSSSIITGNTLGAGDAEKAYRQGVTFYGLSFCMGLLASALILIGSPLMMRFFEVSAETEEIARQLTYAVALMVIFQAVEGVMTKGVLRAGGDTRFLMVADVLFLWVASIPLGYLAGLVWHLPAFWIYVALKTDWVIKAVWCGFRLRSRKWMRRVSVAA